MADTETIASLFERTATLAAKRSDSTSGDAAMAYKLGEAIAKLVAGLVRTLGSDGARKAIEALQADKDRGVITDEHVARDDREIVTAVSSMYRDDVDEE